MKNWNDNEIMIVRSKAGVIVTTHPYDNLIHTGCVPWPPLEIVQKLYKSRQIRAFDDEARQLCVSELGYYCDLQSIHSEDAITWSVFGTAALAPQHVLKKWIFDLSQLLQLPRVLTEKPRIFLWRRLPHPDTLVQGGPEIDAGILTENAIILIEAKWKSEIGTKQGKMRDKDQIQLRCEFLSKYGSRVFPNQTEFVVVEISLYADAFTDSKPVGVTFRSTTWEKICTLDSHPQAKELERYFIWKKEHTMKVKNRIQRNRRAG